MSTPEPGDSSPREAPADAQTATAVESGDARLRLALPRWPRLLYAQDFGEVESRLNNDQVYFCLCLFETIVGREFRRGSSADWRDFRLLVAALGQAVVAINYALDVLQVAYRPRGATPGFLNLHRFRTWMEGAARSADAFRAGVLHGLLRLLNQADLILRVGYPDAIPLGSLFELHFIRPQKEYLPADKFDVFISYKTREYQSQAKALCERLKRDGLSCWLDEQQLRLRASERLEDLEMKRYLKAALEASHLTVFFETYLEATANEDFRGSNTALSWQTFERRYANRLLYIRPRHRMIGFTDGWPGRAYTGEEDLAQQIVGIFRGGYLGRSSRGSEWSHAETGSRKQLRSASAALRSLAEQYFGRSVAISARMALILMAPEVESEFGGGSQPPMGDAILVNLVRSSPYAALMLGGLGIDIASLLAVGAKISRTTWSSPGSYRMFDVFGHTHAGAAALKKQIADASLIDEANLLAGILRFALERNSSPHELLLRTLAYMGFGKDDADRSAKLREIAAGASIASTTEFRPPPAQQWILTAGPRGVLILPFGEAALCAVAGLQGSEAEAFTVNLAQARGIFDPGVLAHLGDLLARRADAAEIDAWVSRHPTLEFAFSDVEALRPADILGPCAKQASPIEIFLLPLRQRAAVAIDVAETEGEPEVGSTLTWALSLLGSDATRQAAPDGWRSQPAVVLGAVSASGATLETSRRDLSPFDLQCEILAPLWRFRGLAQLDYDLL